MHKNKTVAFKNNAPFINCISKVNGVKIYNAEHSDVVMPMYNLLEYSKSYRKTTGSFWSYYRDESSNPLSSNSESFEYKTILQEILIMLTKKLQMMMVMKLIILNMM